MPSQNFGITKALRREANPIAAAMNKLAAWKKGKNPWVTVEGTQTNKRFIKVKANSLWGNPKTSNYNIYGRPEFL